MPTGAGDRPTVDIEFPKPGRFADTFVYDVTYAAGGFAWPRGSAVAMSVPAWYRAVSAPTQSDPRQRADLERKRLGTVLAWASLMLARHRGHGPIPITVHCLPRLPGIPILCPLMVRADDDRDGAPTIAIVTPDAG
ncbi:hypothetical protein [Nocardia blacklockiae]|uniref:hypothetical protein n=1 Tax=Nocardia blacklockiae TaxID=480036 RepID=UPI001895E3DA|nr:hypothetical protein [Nocardia blacklockiae]MBF6171102.1 hypothetical protein [Nocardia blacklockiae]